MDVYGGQRFVCFGAMLSACMWFTIMGFAHAPPAVCIVFAGISYSLLPASLYPLLPEFVPDESFTTVYAILNSLINLVFTVVLVIAGQILGESDVANLGARMAGVGRAGVGALLRGAVDAGTGVGAVRLLQHAAADDDTGPGVDPKAFDYVFAIFITITLTGTMLTAPLAIDAWRMGTGGPLKRKHGH